MVSTRSATAVAITVLLVGGCTTAGPDTTGAGPTTTAPVASSCDAFSNALERTATQFAYLKLAVGSDLDETERLTTLSEYTATLAADAPICAPAATDSLASLQEQTGALADAYVPLADGSVAEGIFTILMGIRATGEQAWEQMGRPVSSWKELPLHEDGSTIE